MVELTIDQGICEFPHAVVNYDTYMGELVECDVLFPLHGSPLRSARSHPAVRSCGPSKKQKDSIALLQFRGGRRNVFSHEISFSHLRSEHETKQLPKTQGWSSVRKVDQREIETLCIPATKKGATGLAIWSSRTRKISLCSP